MLKSENNSYTQKIIKMPGKVAVSNPLFWDDFSSYAIIPDAFYSVQPPGRNSICSDRFPNRLFASQRGYSGFELLGKKFCILYALCEQQLSKQRRFPWNDPALHLKSTNLLRCFCGFQIDECWCRHYDFGLRNILSECLSQL